MNKSATRCPEALCVNGEHFYLASVMPYSEVCVSMGVAGREMYVLYAGKGMVQLFELDGRRFSFPITVGEAGF